MRWWRQSSGPGEENLFYGAVDRWGNSILLGTYTGPADFGGGPLPAPEGSSGLFIASYSPGGKHRWSAAYLPSAESDGLSVFPYDWGSGEVESVRILPMGLPLAVNRRGEFFVAMSFQSPLDIGSRTLTPDLVDTLLMRLCP